MNKFSKHVLSNCSYSADPISMEHLMLEDILASVDNDDFHVVLADDEAEEEEDGGTLLIWHYLSVSFWLIVQIHFVVILSVFLTSIREL